MPDPLTAAAVILAAGASRRMGRNKMLLPLEGESLVRRTAGRALRAGLAPVVVVLGHEAEQAQAELAGLDVEIALNPSYTGPTSGSLHRGLERVGPEVGAAVVLLADMVLVTEEMIGAVLKEAVRTDAPLVVSRYGDVKAPPLLFRRALFPELLAWTGEGCGKAVVLRHEAEAAFIDWPVAALTDVDTPQDLEAAEQLLGSASGRPPGDL
jgi:molybdenum cofactor cytidylyltransferase